MWQQVGGTHVAIDRSGKQSVHDAVIRFCPAGSTQQQSDTRCHASALWLNVSTTTTDTGFSRRAVRPVTTCIN